MSGSFAIIEAKLREFGARRFFRLARGAGSGDDTLARLGAMATGLGDLGLEHGEVVGVVAEPTETCVLALLALWSRGMVAFLLSAREPDAVLSETLARQRCRLLLSARRVAAPGVAQIEPKKLLEPLRRRAAPRLSGAPRLLPGSATVLRTSGTSGEPKLVVHALDHHIASAQGALDFLRVTPQDSWLLTLPMSHVSGLAPLFRTLLAGAALALPTPGQDLADALVHFRPSHVSVVSTQLVRLLGNETGQRALGGCKVVLAGGGPLPVPLRRWALGCGTPLIVSYGSTEAASLITAEREPAQLLRENSCGQALPGRTLALRANGAIAIGGASLMSGYLSDDGVADRRDADGLFVTSDLGVLQGGRLFVVGRMDRMFISGGENIHPEEIEHALLRVPGIAEAVVVPTPHPEFGMRPIAFLRRHPGAVTSRAALLEELARSLPRAKVPDAFWLLPEQAEPKPDRGQLERLAAAGDAIPF
jgi:O-succinylbenzoic acid--CoA ligase